MSDENTTTEKPAKPLKVSLTRDAQKCGKEGCKRPYRAKGYCVTHYRLWRRGEVEAHKSRYKICSKEACRKPAGRWGVCDEHRGVKPAGEAAAAT